MANLYDDQFKRRLHMHLAVCDPISAELLCSMQLLLESAVADKGLYKSAYEANAKACLTWMDALRGIINSARDGRDIPEWLNERLIEIEVALLQASQET